ncbi:EamA family transporter [Caballeronia sp. LjRoot31]|uniref:EamA family transporter n=1 Tax=Caballeronia sp. LjRoot31 TaxID=3342324 RepID=UPI003ECEBDC0
MAFVLLWSGGFPIAKMAVGYAPQLTLLALRYGCTVCLLIPLFVIIKPALPKNRTAWGNVGLVLSVLVVGVYAGLVLSVLVVEGQCRVGAFSVSGLRESDFLFITISHCAWRHVISLSKATKKRSKENAFKPRYPKCPQRAVLIHRCPKSTVLARATDV